MENQLANLNDEYDGIEMGDIEPIATKTIVGGLTTLVIFAIFGFCTIVFLAVTNLF